MFPDDGPGVAGVILLFVALAFLVAVLALQR